MAPPSSPEADGEGWAPETVAAYLADFRVLERVNDSINDAVRNRARNPLLHMARVLRREPSNAAPSPPAALEASNASSLEVSGTAPEVVEQPERAATTTSGGAADEFGRMWVEPEPSAGQMPEAGAVSTGPSDLAMASKPPDNFREVEDGSSEAGQSSAMDERTEQLAHSQHSSEFGEHGHRPGSAEETCSQSLESSSSADEALEGGSGYDAVLRGASGGALGGACARRRAEASEEAAALLSTPGVDADELGGAAGSLARVHVPTIEALAKVRRPRLPAQRRARPSSAAGHRGFPAVAQRSLLLRPPA